MPADDRRRPSRSSVWLQARPAGGTPVAAEVRAGQAEAAEMASTEPCGRSRPPPAEVPQRRLKSHEGLDPEPSAPVESELAARVSPSPAVVRACATVRRVMSVIGQAMGPCVVR